jgi:hypothetical protein
MLFPKLDQKNKRKGYEEIVNIVTGTAIAYDVFGTVC